MSDPRDETICDVSATLLQLLKGTLGAANVVLGPPRNATTLLTLFLYKVIENAYLRNDGRRSLPADVDGRLVEQEPPLIVDLYYLLTAHHATDQLEAHRGLSRAMRVFYDNAILRGSAIQATKDRGLTSDSHAADHAEPDLDGGHDPDLERVPRYAVRDFRDLSRDAGSHRIESDARNRPRRRPDSPSRALAADRSRSLEMADVLSALAPDTLTRSVWVVVDPRDAATGARVSATLRVRLRNVAAEPVLSRSGLYCFTDLNLAAANYVVDVQPLGEAQDRYFGGETEFPLQVPPVSGKPLDRNAVAVDLFPRPAYPFGDRDIPGARTTAEGERRQRGRRGRHHPDSRWL